MSHPPTPPTHLHPTPLSTLAPHLLPHLPHSLPLLRRLQFHHSPPTARTLATISPTDITPTTSNTPSQFAAAWVDRTRAPETECWLFSTYETLTPPQQNHHKQEAKFQILAILATIASLPSDNDLMVVGTLPEPLLELIGGKNVKKLIPSKVLTRDLTLARKAESEGITREISIVYMKWLLASPCPSLIQSNEGLPDGYLFDALCGEKGEFRLVISKTDIPRTEESLARLGCVGIRYLGPPSKTIVEEGGEKGKLVAWAFLGVDGSLTSLYVEPEHRGRGLAKAASGRLLKGLVEDPGSVGFRMVLVGAEGGGGGVGEGEMGMGLGEGWADSDVAVDNLESAGVARGLGGRQGWEVRWVSVDLGRVREVVGGM